MFLQKYVKNPGTLADKFVIAYNQFIKSNRYCQKEKEIRMGKFEQEAKDLLTAIGGKENVTAVTHCATRMRFVLGDDKKADVKTIEAIPAVKGLSPMQVNSKLSLVMMYQSFITISLLYQVLKVFLKKLLNQLPRATKTQFSVL